MQSRETIACASRLELMAVPGIPLIEPGDDLGTLLREALERAGISLTDHDVVVVTSKVVSRAEGRFIDLASIVPSEQALTLASQTGKDPRMVELILRDSTHLSRIAPGVLVVRHRLGFITANASIDCSNARPAQAAPESGPWALILPEAPDASARQLRASLSQAFGVQIGVIITDSLSRAFRVGTVGAAIGVSGLPALWDQRGEVDLYGRTLETTITALADQVAAAADLVAGQAAEARPVIVVRGLRFPASEQSSSALYRLKDQDLYA